MKLIYCGPSPEVVIPGVATCVNGVPFDVSADLGARLLEQDTFKKAPAKNADPAASTESAAEPQEG